MLDAVSMALWYLVNPIAMVAIESLDYRINLEFKKSLSKQIYSAKDIKFWRHTARKIGLKSIQPKS